MSNIKPSLPAKPTFGTAMKSLKAQHRLFVMSYVAHDGNVTQAAISAGYAAKSAHNTGHRLMKNEYIKVAIDEFLQPIREQVAFDAENRMNMLADIANTPAEDKIKVDHQLRAMDIAARMSGDYVHKQEIEIGGTFEEFRRDWGKVQEEANATNPVLRGIKRHGNGPTHFRTALGSTVDDIEDLEED